MQNKKIVITGGPGTGKSSVIHHLEQQGYRCLHEVSREITADAQKQGVTQLFLEKPILFSEKLREARIDQYKEASQSEENIVFFDRGLPDVVAYMDYYHTSYPSEFTEPCIQYRYDQVFLLPPWKEIYQNDAERYENFEQAMLIHTYLKKAYLSYGYEPLEVPKLSVVQRGNFILSNLLM